MTPSDIFDPSLPGLVPKHDKATWDQARGELLAFASHLQARGSGITASQLVLAIARADYFLELLAQVQELKNSIPFHVMATEADGGLPDSYEFKGQWAMTAGEIRKLDDLLTRIQGTPYPKKEPQKI